MTTSISALEDKENLVGDGDMNLGLAVTSVDDGSLPLGPSENHMMMNMANDNTNVTATVTMPAKRLSFGDVSLHAPPSKTSQWAANQEKGGAGIGPAAFREALKECNEAQGRFTKMQEVATEQCEGASEADVEYLKAQVSKQKGEFVNVDVKYRFLQSLAAGDITTAPPTAAESREVNAELARVSEEVRRLKKLNAAAKEEATNLIDSVADGVSTYETQAAQLQADLDALEQEIAEQELCGDNDDTEEDMGVDEEDEAVAAELRAEEEEARNLESQMATARSEARELQAAVLPLEGEVAMLRARARTTNAATGRNRAATAASERAVADTAWLRSHAALLEALGGVQLQRVDEDVLHVRMATVVPDAAGPRTVEHELAIFLSPGQTSLNRIVLEPSDVPVSDLAAEYEGSARLANMLREVRQRIASFHVRNSLLTSAAEERGGAMLISEAISGHAIPYPLQAGVEGAQAVMHVPVDWPQPGTTLGLVRVDGVPIEVSSAVCDAMNANAAICESGVPAFLAAVEEAVAAVTAAAVNVEG